MKITLTFCAAILTTMIVHAETLQITGFEVTPTNGISISLTLKGTISHISASAGVIKRDSANLISSVGGLKIHRDGGIITSIGGISIHRDSAFIVTDIGGIKIKRTADNMIESIGNAIIKRDSTNVIVSIKGDPRVRPLFEVTDESN